MPFQSARSRSTPAQRFIQFPSEVVIAESRRRLEGAGDAVDTNRVALAIYRAPLAAEPWQEVVEHLAVHTDSHAVIVVRPPDVSDLGFVVCWPQHAEIEHAYRAHWWKLDPFRKLPIGEVVTIDDYVGAEAWLESEFYRSLLCNTGVRYGLGANLVSENGTIFRIRLYRTPSASDFGDDDKARLKALLPHFQQALQLASRIEENETGNELYESALDRLRIATFVLDERRQVLRCNAIAETLLAQEDGLRLGPNGLEAVNKADRAAMRALFDGATAGGVNAMAISQSSGRRKLGLVVRHIPMRASSQGKRRPAWAVFASDADARTNAPVEMLIHLFEFTPAEAVLALKLADGCSLDDAAEVLGIRRNTARAHLRAIFAKANVTRQADLVRLLLNGVIRLCGSAGPGSDGPVGR